MSEMGYRQGDVYIKMGEIPQRAKKLAHRVLAEGEVTGHRHEVTGRHGLIELYESEGQMYMRVMSDEATITHQEHGPVTVPKGDYVIGFERDYQPEGWSRAKD